MSTEELLIYLGAIWQEEFTSNTVIVKFFRHQPTDDEAEQVRDYYRKRCKNTMKVRIERRRL